MKEQNPPRIKITTTIGFALIIFIFVLIGAVTWVEIHSLNRLTSIIYKHPLEVSNAALRASMGVAKMHRSMKDVVLADEQLPIEVAISFVNDEEKIVYQNLDLIQNKILGVEGKALIRETIVFFKDWRLIREEVIDLVRNGDRLKAASITKGKGAQHELLLENKMLELTAYARNKADGFINKSIHVHQRASNVTVIIVTTGILLSLIIAYITTKQIISAFRLQKEAEKAISESSYKIKLFAYSIAHDLKSPAIALHGLTRLLCTKHMDNLAGKGKHLCGQIQRSAERIMTLADTINIFVSTKETPLNIEKISLKEVLQIIREEFSARINVRSIEWIEPENFPATILADRVSVLRVLRNLIDNAIKYGGDGLKKIVIGYKKDIDFHVLSVTDDGKGVECEGFNKFFGPFQRHEDSQGICGMGLGLAIVKEIAELHKGKVWVNQNPKGGVTFNVSISMHMQ